MGQWCVSNLSTSSRTEDRKSEVLIIVILVDSFFRVLMDTPFQFSRNLGIEYTSALFIYLFFYLSFYLFIYLFIQLFIYSFIYLFIYLFIEGIFWHYHFLAIVQYLPRLIGFCRSEVPVRLHKTKLQYSCNKNMGDIQQNQTYSLITTQTLIRLSSTWVFTFEKYMAVALRYKIRW